MDKYRLNIRLTVFHNVVPSECIVLCSQETASCSHLSFIRKHGEQEVYLKLIARGFFFEDVYVIKMVLQAEDLHTKMKENVTD